MNHQESRKLPAPTKFRDGSENDPIELEVEQLTLLGTARIDAVGSENIYMIKDNLNYFCKVMNTEAYDVGNWDFEQQRKLPEVEQHGKSDNSDLVTVSASYGSNHMISARSALIGPRAMQHAELNVVEARNRESSSKFSFDPFIERLPGGVVILHTEDQDIPFIIPPGLNEHKALMDGARLDKLEAEKLFERARQLLARAQGGEIAAGLCNRKPAPKRLTGQSTLPLETTA